MDHEDEINPIVDVDNWPPAYEQGKSNVFKKFGDASNSQQNADSKLKALFGLEKNFLDTIVENSI